MYKYQSYKVILIVKIRFFFTFKKTRTPNVVQGLEKYNI